MLEGLLPVRWPIESEYDADGELTATTGPAGQSTKYSYDADGNLVAVTGPDGGTTATAYDLDNEPVKVTLPDGAATSANLRHRRQRSQLQRRQRQCDHLCLRPARPPALLDRPHGAHEHLFL